MPDNPTHEDHRYRSHPLPCPIERLPVAGGPRLGPGAECRVRRLPEQPASTRPRRWRARRHLRPAHPGAGGGHERDRQAELPARIPHGDLGLPGRPGGRRTRGRGPGAAGATRRHAGARATALRRGPSHRGGGVGRGKQFWPDFWQIPAGAGAGHAVVFWPAPGLFSRRVLRHAAHLAGRAHRARAAGGFVGRRLRPHPVHAHHL